MKYSILLFIFTILVSVVGSSKEITSYLCHKRGYEIIFPYEEAIYKIKKSFRSLPIKKEKILKKFRKQFEKDFHGISLYKAAGCSNARLSEYLDCLISKDGKNCRIYYSQMRIID